MSATTSSSKSDTTAKPMRSIFTILSFVLLILIGVASGGLFLYKNLLTKQKAALFISLNGISGTFEKDKIAELELYDKRISVAKDIFTKHIVISPIFVLLGKLTLPLVQYTNFTQHVTLDGFSIKLSGVASDYKTIALQADAFNSPAATQFKNVVFSNITKDKNTIKFDLEFMVDPQLVSYEKSFLSNELPSSLPDSTKDMGSISSKEPVSLPVSDTTVQPSPNTGTTIITP